MQFTWDPSKDDGNFRKHGVWFEAAQHAFSDPALLAFEPQVERGEYRFPVLGMIGDHTILYIAYAYEIDPATGEEIIRIISARKASPYERKLYHEHR
jgi:uncharacterized DUF497 family protein